jgi:DNA-binding GntR family transcriptional regulator
MKYPQLNKDISLSETVYQTICNRIITGDLKPGQKITEAWLAKTMGISRAPVREAYKRLKEDKLIILVPRSGCFIADLSTTEIDEIFELRKCLEPMALKYAMNNFDKKELEVIRKKFLRCLKTGGEQFTSREIALDSELHGLIAEKSCLPNLHEMLDKLRARVQIFRIKEAYRRERAIDALREHLDILNAILEGNTEAAITALVRHIEHSRQNVAEHNLEYKSKEK